MFKQQEHHSGHNPQTHKSKLKESREMLLSDLNPPEPPNFFHSIASQDQSIIFGMLEGGKNKPGMFKQESKLHNNMSTDTGPVQFNTTTTLECDCCHDFKIPLEFYNLSHFYSTEVKSEKQTQLLLSYCMTYAYDSILKRS